MEGGGFRDAVSKRGKFKSKLRWGVGEGGKLMQVRQKKLFQILKFTHQCIFRARYMGQGELNCGRELKRSVLCLAPHTIQFVQLTRISGYLLMPLIIQRETQCYCFSSLQKFFVTIKSYILNCTSRTFSLLLPVVDFFCI